MSEPMLMVVGWAGAVPVRRERSQDRLESGASIRTSFSFSLGQGVVGGARRFVQLCCLGRAQGLVLFFESDAAGKCKCDRSNRTGTAIGEGARQRPDRCCPHAGHCRRRSTQTATLCAPIISTPISSELRTSAECCSYIHTRTSTSTRTYSHLLAPPPCQAGVRASTVRAAYFVVAHLRAIGKCCFAYPPTLDLSPLRLCCCVLHLPEACRLAPSPISPRLYCFSARRCPRPSFSESTYTRGPLQHHSTPSTPRPALHTR